MSEPDLTQDPELEITEELLGVVLTMCKLDPSRPDLTWPEDTLHLRIIGCPDMRQCEVKYEHGVIMFRERGLDDSHVVMMPLEKVLRRVWVSIIKANDGLPQAEAFKSGLRTLPGFNYQEVADAPQGLAPDDKL